MADDMAGGTAPSMGMDTMGGEHVLTAGAFLVAWLGMMTAMMFPAVAPVVKLYGRAATAGRVAPLPFFVAGYIAVWGSIGLPAYVAWRALLDPIDEARSWAGQLAGAVLVAAAVWQLTPLKSMCLRHCRSPISFFLRFGARVTRPVGALRMGVTHGLFCLGCCWALMLLLFAGGVMNLTVIVGLTAIVLIEKLTPIGVHASRALGVVFAAAGVWFLVS